MNNNDNNALSPLTRLVTLRWFDNAICPDETLAALVEQCQNSHADEISKTVMGIAKPICMSTFVHGNAVDVKITSFHGLIDLDKDLYPVLTDDRAANEQVFSRGVFSLADMGMDSGDKLYYLRAYIQFVQDTWALPGSYIGLSMHVVREIASLAYWKNWNLEFRLDKRGDALLMAVHFPKLQETDFVINIFREIETDFNPYPLMKEWLWFFRSIAKDAAELWTIRVVVNESIAEKIACLNDGDVIIMKEQTPPYPCQ